jgi:putative zinc finger/helix-turn-helix YgiT family protein
MNTMTTFRSDREETMAATIASHHCADHLSTVERERDFPIHGSTVTVHEEVLRCVVCGEEYSYAQAIAAERHAGEIYRQQNGFLHPDEIVSMRRKWGVTQSQLELALGLGRKTVARWEAGRVLQTRALDNLLRAIDRFPAVLTYLAERQDVTLEPHPEWAQPPAVAARELALPRSLLARLQEEAAEEGTSAEAYAAAVLAQGMERRSMKREVDHLNRRFDGVFEHVSQWNADALHMEPVEDWLRDHQEEQMSCASKAVAF